MASTVIPNLMDRAIDANGETLPGAKMYWYLAGTSTPTTVYTDSATSVPAANPVVADAGGLFVPLYAKDGTYKVVFTDQTGTVLYTVDNYAILTSGGGSTAVSMPIVAKTANYTVQSTDRNSVFLVDASAAVGQNIVITADSATLGNGFPFYVVNAGSAGTVTLAGTGSQTVNGAATFTLNSQYQGVLADSNGVTGWYLIAATGGAFVTAATFYAGFNLAGSVNFLNGANSPAGPLFPPAGRLTLTSGVSVLTSDVTGATTVYYTPHNGNFIPIYDGVGWGIKFFAELSQALSDNTKSPAATSANNGYDYFVWNDSGTIRCTRGPAWSSVTAGSSARGTGAGTTELQRLNGILVNKVAITNGPAANQGTYVGSILTNGSNQVDWATNLANNTSGNNTRLAIWNAYNRVAVSATVHDGTASWSLPSGTTTRAANGGTGNRVTIFAGLVTDAVAVDLLVAVTLQGGLTTVGIGVNVVNANSGTYFGTQLSGINTNSNTAANYRGYPGLGTTFYQWTEAQLSNTNTVTGQSSSGLSLLWAA